MREQRIGEVVALAALTAQPGVCPNCWMTYRATKPRPPLLWCWHRRTAARQLHDGTWTTVENVTPTELAKLRAGIADDQP